jgi:hypothetical protein
MMYIVYKIHYFITISKYFQELAAKFLYFLEGVVLMYKNIFMFLLHYLMIVRGMLKII